MPAGYSGTPLVRKLGIRDGHRVGIFEGPPEVAELLADAPESVRVEDAQAGADPYDVILLFARDEAALRSRIDLAVSLLTEAGGLWLAWLKQSSGIPTDVNREVVREVGLATGLVDNKVCAVDERWSGLRFVRRLSARGAKRA